MIIYANNMTLKYYSVKIILGGLRILSIQLSNALEISLFSREHIIFLKVHSSEYIFPLDCIYDYIKVNGINCHKIH